MAIDVGTIPQSVARTFTVGLRTEQLSVLDSICEKFTEKGTLKGDLPRMLSGRTLGRVDNSSLPPFARAKAHRGSMSTTPYNCTASVGLGEISDEERNDLEVYGDDGLQNGTIMAVTDSNLGVDFRGFTVLESTVLNNSYDAVADGTGKWSDAALGRPLLDMVEARETLAVGSDSLIYGPAIKRVLLRHPDLIAEFSQFNAGQLDLLGLNNLLARKLGIPLANIHYIEKWFNSANENQTEVIEYLADDLFWIGHKRDFIMVDPTSAPENRKTEVTRVANGRLYEVQHTRYVDFVRPTKELGVTFKTLI